MSKQIIWQNRMKREKRCTKCGRPTETYTTDKGVTKQYTICEEHRFYNRLKYATSRMK